MNDIQITHIALQTLLFVIFMISGLLLSKTKTSINYWKLALIPLVAFAIISGLRFGRDYDYNVYYDVYTTGEYKTMEPLFSLLVDVFHWFDLPYYFFVFFCSTFLIFSFLYLLKEFKNFSLFILPLFLGIQDLENLMRWFLAFSFVMIGIKMLINKRYKLTVLFFIVSTQFHLGMLFCFPLILGCYFFWNRKTINSKIAIVLFAMTLFLGSTDQLLRITSVVNMIGISGGSEKADIYKENAANIASGGMKSGLYERSFSNNVRIFLCFAIPIFFSDKEVVNRFRQAGLLWFYNLSIFSIIIMPIFILVEIFNRIAFALNCISIIFVGVTLYYGFKTRKQNGSRNFTLLLAFALLIYPILKKPFVAIENKNAIQYIWDANGRNYLPIDIRI